MRFSALKLSSSILATALAVVCVPTEACSPTPLLHKNSFEQLRCKSGEMPWETDSVTIYPDHTKRENDRFSCIAMPKGAPSLDDLATDQNRVERALASTAKQCGAESLTVQYYGPARGKNGVPVDEDDQESDRSFWGRLFGG